MSLATLQAQSTYFQTDGDLNLEHYRYAAFRRILSSHSELTDIEIERYIALAQMDADPAMAQAALADLIRWPHLTAEQFENLSYHSSFAAPLFQKLVLRRRLSSAMSTEPVISAATFAGCLESHDTTVQRELLSHRGLTQEQLQALAEQGASRAIRNSARTSRRGKQP